MRELILLRHAHAEPADTGQADLDRPLSPHGIAEAESAGRWLREQRLVPDRVLCSPARRARETLEAVLELTGYIEQRLDERIYDATPAPWLAWWTNTAMPSGCCWSATTRAWNGWRR